MHASISEWRVKGCIGKDGKQHGKSEHVFGAYGLHNFGGYRITGCNRNYILPFSHMSILYLVIKF